MKGMSNNISLKVIHLFMLVLFQKGFEAGSHAHIECLLAVAGRLPVVLALRNL